MQFRFTNGIWLWLLAPVAVWTLWWSLKSFVSISAGRRRLALAIRLLVLALLIGALAGMQWLRPQEGMVVNFALDRSDSIPSGQQEWAVEFVKRAIKDKPYNDRAGIVVFGAEAAIEAEPRQRIEAKVQAVVGAERTDLAGAIRLATAAFPETGQKRIVVLSDGNENLGDAMAAALAAKPLGVGIDVVPLGVARGSDVSVQKLSLPSTLKKGQPFEVKIFAQADKPQPGVVRLFRNDQLLGEQAVELAAGKNLFTFSQNLPDAGFYKYDVQVETAGDPIAQNNRAINFASVRGDPKILVVSSDPAADEPLVTALRASSLETRLIGVEEFPGTLAEIQSYDAMFLCNVSAGDLGGERMRFIESAVRDFGVGLVCVGGDQAYAAGGYRGTPLEAALPVDMELSSKKVLPTGSLVLVMHGMEFNNGNQVARDIAIGVLDALGPQDELGVVLWDGTERWLFPLTKVGDRKDLGKTIAGMNQGDLPSFQGVMTLGHQGLKASTGHLKHMIVFSDGDPGAPSKELMQAMVDDRITVSTVLIAGHAGPQTMISIAEQGRGRFYDVRSPAQLPQIFIKEAAVILKSAIFEEPFRPQIATASEIIRGIAATEYPLLQGYVATTIKPRAELVMVSEKADPVLAQWQYGLGRAVAYTSDARAKWGRDWIGWARYRQFWAQIAQWSLRRVENADFTTEVTVDKGEGLVTVEALDAEGNFRNFLNLQTTVLSPKGERQTVRLQQTGPGRYEARFPTKEVGAYLMNLMDLREGQLRASQVLGASVNYSPEFAATEPHVNFLRRLAEVTGGELIDPSLPGADAGVFSRGRRKTFQPIDLWEWLLGAAILLFVVDVGVRRIQVDRDEWLRATQTLRRLLSFGRIRNQPAAADESLAALLARRDQVRARQTVAIEPKPELFQPASGSTRTDFVLPGGELHVSPSAGMAGKAAASVGRGAAATGESSAESSAPAGPESTTSRLLAAKRRAQKPRG